MTEKSHDEQYDTPIRIKIKTKIRLDQARLVVQMKKNQPRIIIDEVMNELLEIFENENRKYYNQLKEGKKI